MKDVAKQRLASQGFHSTEFKLPGDVVSRLVAVQAQDYAGAKWSIGVRLPGSSDKTVEKAVAAGSIVRTWALRGTLHFVAAGDVHWLLALIAPRIISRNARRYGQLELDEPTLAASNKVVAEALEDGKELDRNALREIVQAEGISAEGQRIFYMLQRAALDRLICQGTAPKNNPLYRALKSSDNPGRLIEREEALAELAARYFASRGPATLDDFIWWSGLTAADARIGLEGARPILAQVMIEGQTYWRGEPVLEQGGTAPDIMLLPGFDEYLVGYRDRTAAIEERFMAAWSKGKAMFTPSVIRRGQVIGLWKRALKKDRVEIGVDLFTGLSESDVAALEIAAGEYGRFLDKKAQIELA